LPVLCYYRPNRGIGPENYERRAHRKGAKSADKVISPQLRAYDHAFSHTVGPFQDFVRWFRLEEDRENEVRLRKDPNHRNARLEGVRRAVLRFMNALGSHAFDNLRMERAHGGRPRPLVQPGGVPPGRQVSAEPLDRPAL